MVLLGKNSHIHTLLQQTAVEKIYHALTYGGPEPDAGEINLPIARRPLPSLLREVSPEGKPSLTRYRVLETKGQFSKLSLQPVTGRTHQLRVHCAAMGFPILGDPQYGSVEARRVSEALGLTSQLLCAYSLSFTHPVTGETMQIVSSMDVNLSQLKSL